MASSYLPQRAQSSVAHPPIAFVAQHLSCNRVPVALCRFFIAFVTAARRPTVTPFRGPVDPEQCFPQTSFA
jgi:hypothetical protein